MKITIETIPHGDQRYPTVGDYFHDDDVAQTVHFRVSDLGDWRKEAAVAVHELVEFLLCLNDDVTVAEIDAFDMAYTGDGEPGDDPAAPYHRQHCFATAVERMLIAALGVPWASYEQAVEALP